MEEFLREYVFCECFCQFVQDYWDSRRDEEDNTIANHTIIFRKYFDIKLITQAYCQIKKSHLLYNNISIEKAIPVKEGISERAKRARRQKLRAAMDSEDTSFIESQLLEETKNSIPEPEVSILKSPVEVQIVDNNDELPVPPTEIKILPYITQESGFKESLPFQIPVIDRMVLITGRETFNEDMIPFLPNEGALSIMITGRYMLLNIDFEAINHDKKSFETINSVFIYLYRNNFFNKQITEQFKAAELKGKIFHASLGLLQSFTFELWGLEVAFDLINVKAKDLLLTSKFRAYTKTTGHHTYYSKDSSKHSLICVYDRKEKLRNKGQIVPYRDVTRFEIKYYHTYMKSKTFQFNLDYWLNFPLIKLAMNNKTQIAKAIAHVFKRKNPFLKLQQHIADIESMQLLKWILLYAFPVQD